MGTLHHTHTGFLVLNTWSALLLEFAEDLHGHVRQCVLWPGHDLAWPQLLIFATELPVGTTLQHKLDFKLQFHLFRPAGRYQNWTNQTLWLRAWVLSQDRIIMKY